jgi:glutamate racemase
MDQRPIGIFDSGVGGLTVLSAIAKALPGENLYYFGDTARFPYGPKSKKTILGYSRQICRFLLKFDVKKIIIACNTASALALQDLKCELPIPISGVIEPTIEALANNAREEKRRIGVIGTRSTIKSGIYPELISRRFPGYTSFQKACPLFVTLVEEGWADKDISRRIAHEYMDEIVREKIDSLILGCTHYPVLKNMLSQEFPHLEFIDASIETTKALKKYLTDKNLLAQRDKGEIHIYISDLTDYFATLEKLFFGGEITSIRDIRLEEII